MDFDVIVIGGGPGGYVAAIRAAQLGLKTAVVEREALGGICLNWGCIPTKALLKSAELYETMGHLDAYGLSVTGRSYDFDKVVQRSRGVSKTLTGGIGFLMKKNKIEVIEGEAKLEKGSPAPKVVVALKAGGSRTVQAKHVILATGARARAIPAIGLEPDGDKVWSYREALLPSTNPKSLIVIGSGAIGIVGNVENLGLEALGVKVEKTHIVVDSHNGAGVPGLYAIGDVAGPPWLAHKASHEGIHCVEHIAGLKPTNLHSPVPGCTYATPQVASVGLTEANAKAAGYEVKVGMYPFKNHGKNIASGETDGFVKTVFDAKTGALLGAHMIGAEVTEMIQGFTIAMTMEATEAELMATCFPHPTMSEAMHESTLAAYGRAIHI